MGRVWRYFVVLGLALSGANTLILFYADTDATSITAVSNRENPNTVSQTVPGVADVKEFGARGNGTADDTAAVHAALRHVATVRGRIYFPPGLYRVTSGFAQSTNYADVVIEGPGSSYELRDNQGAVVILDSPDPKSFFYEHAARHHLQVRNITFKAQQYVADRAFFKFSGPAARHTFENVNFESVERPIVYKAGTYFQNASFTNVQFHKSGTIHSETTNLVGTLLMLNNVNHESTVPANSEKIVANLQGIRQIQATNFLLEGALPSTGWTILKLNNSVHDAPWTKDPTAEFHGFWSEWAGTQPTYAVHQIGGRVRWSQAALRINATTKYKLSSSGVATIEHSSFAGTSDDIRDRFEIEDYKSHVIFKESTIRGGKKSGSETKMSFVLSNFVQDGGTETTLNPTILSNTEGSTIYRWDGGYVRDPATFVLSSGTTSAPSTNATYGRHLDINPKGDSLSAQFRVPLRNALTIGAQVNVTATFKLPTFTGGSFLLRAIEDGVATVTLDSYSTTSSGQTLSVALATRVSTATSTFAVQFSSAATGVSSNLELYALTLKLGNETPRIEYPSYPATITTTATAVPATGTWAQGDRVLNTAPTEKGTAGSKYLIMGWVCTLAGTPGTWVETRTLTGN